MKSKDYSKNQNHLDSPLIQEEESLGHSCAPPPFTPTANTDVIQKHDEEGSGHSHAAGGTGSGGNTVVPPTTGERDTSSETCNVIDSIGKQIFLAIPSYGPRTMVPNNRRGGFEAVYYTASQMLNINVRGQLRFADGLQYDGSVVSTGDPKLMNLATILNSYATDLEMQQVAELYTWGEAERDEYRVRFYDLLSETNTIYDTANTGMRFRVQRACWGDIKASVDTTVSLTEVNNQPADLRTGDAQENRDNNGHLSVSVVRAPTGGEVNTVRGVINDIQNRERISVMDHNITRGGTTYSNRRNDAHDNAMILGHNRLHRKQKLTRSVHFDHDSADLSSTMEGRLNRFINDYREGDHNHDNSTVTLNGYASAPGSADYNQALVQRRLDAVHNYLIDNGFQNVTTRVSESNHGDTNAETLPGDERTQSRERRVDLVIGDGQPQNVLAHEMGHVFGLDDEYASGDTSISGTGSNVGDNVDHDQISRDIGAGSANAENSDNIMSMGNNVRGQHYSTFGWALRELTGLQWELDQ